jgi:flagellar biosynthesis protein FliP
MSGKLESFREEEKKSFERREKSYKSQFTKIPIAISNFMSSTVQTTPTVGHSNIEGAVFVDAHAVINHETTNAAQSNSDIMIKSPKNINAKQSQIIESQTISNSEEPTIEVSAMKDDMRGKDHIGSTEYAKALAAFVVMKIQAPFVIGLYAQWY